MTRTHAPPADLKAAIEIPPPVKKHLGHDDARSWIGIAEGNEFVWPGYDLRKAPKTDNYEFGFLPPRLFTQVRAAFVHFIRPDRRKQRPDQIVNNALTCGPCAARSPRGCPGRIFGFAPRAALETLRA
jgi:hypothetical protein